MGFRLVKHLESTNYNRKLFYLDRGAIDLPPIVNLTDIAPGSESRSLTTGEKWILNTHYKWVWIGAGECCCCGGGNSSDTGDDDILVPGEEPTIEGVNLTPLNITVAPGATVAFKASIEGNSALTQGITWTVKGQKSPNTKISADGILTIAETEKATSITVRATSQGDTSKYAQAVVTLDKDIVNPTEQLITSINLIPSYVEIIRGKSFMFRTEVAGANVVDDSVTYKIEGQESNSTSIGPDGILRIGFDEMSDMIIVTATSNADPTKISRSVVSTVAPQDAKNPIDVEKVEIIPEMVEVGQGFSTQFAAVIKGDMNPPQDVIWQVVGASDPNTRITPNGMLVVGENERLGTISVIATSQFAPDVFGESFVKVISKDDPKATEKRVDAVIVIPDMCEMEENTYKVFSAVVVGSNNPNQAVTWAMTGNNSVTTYITEQGTLALGKGETAKVLHVTATSVEDPTKSATAIITVTAITADQGTGIEEIPKVPLDADYVRTRLPNGEATWKMIEKGTDEENPPSPEVKNIVISPEAVTVAPGSVITYTAEVNTVGDMSEVVTWTVAGNDSTKTVISSDGVLTIAEDETSRLLVIKATSVVDPAKYGRATVAVDEDAELVTMVTKITVDPSNVEIIKGRSIMFNAQVSGVNVTNAEVEWSVEGAQSNTTAIDENGILTVALDEISKVIIVRATSKFDETKSSSAVVTTIEETQASNPLKVTDVEIKPETNTVGQGTTAQFAAIVKGEQNPPTDVVWKIAGATSANTRISQNGLLTVGEDERIGTLSVLAYSVFSPDIYGEADVKVVSKNTPGITEPTVIAVIVTPDLIEMPRGSEKAFTAVVIGNNDPSQKVTWKLYGAESPATYITEQGVLKVAPTETAPSLQVQAASVQDETKVTVAAVVLTAPTTLPDTGIEDVPKAPLGAKYVRQRLENGDSAWVLVPEEEDATTQPDPEILDIAVDPEALTVAPGSVITYTATMRKVGEISDEVTWSIKGNNSERTYITPDGILYIDEEETSALITVRATSVLDNTKYGRATVAVDEDAPLVVMVTGVKVIPNQCEIIRGRSMKFQAVVTGVNLMDEDVIWSIIGNNNTETTIDQNGVLAVHRNESASVIVVTATSKTDPTKSNTAVVSVKLPEEVDNPYEIHSVSIAPEVSSVAKGYNGRLVATVTGIYNPPQDVIWEMTGNTSPSSHVSTTGIVFVAPDELAQTLTVTTTAVYAPDKSAAAMINVVAADTPGAGETTIDAVKIAPEMVNASKGEKITFKASIMGKNNPSQAVKFTISGNTSPKTLINKLGVLEIAIGEESKAITVRATSVEDPTKWATAYVTVSEEVYASDKGIPDVPELPLETEYVRKRDASGKSVWVAHECKGTDTGYLGTFDTKDDLDKFEIPEGTADGDFAIVTHDETHSNLPAIYTTQPNEYGELEMRFETVLAKQFILGDKLDILYVLDNGVHSEYVKDIEVMSDFDHTDKRYELYTSPSGWRLVTELHPGFWNEVMQHPDWYKMIVGMKNENGDTRAYITCFTDDHEFEHHKEQVIYNPEPYRNVLSWTNTVGKGNTFIVSDGTNYRRYEFDRDTMTMTVVYSETIAPSEEPGVSPWATVVGEYTLLANGEVIGPLEGVTDNTGYLWTSEHENFMIGSAGNGTQMFCYNIDTDDYFIFDVPGGAKADYQFATDINERFFIFWINTATMVWGDRQEKRTRIINWKRSTTSSGLSEPSPDTRPSLSVDGRWYLHTSTNPSTREFYIEDTESMQLYENEDNSHNSGVDGTSSCSTQFNDGRVVFNNIYGLIGCYTMDTSTGVITELYKTTPFEGYYIQHNTMMNNNLLYIKGREGNGPLWYVFDPYAQRVVGQSQYTDHATFINPPAKTYLYPIYHNGVTRWLMTRADGTGMLIERENGQWIETVIPFGGLENDAHNYHQPLLMDDGRVLVTQDANGAPIGYDVVNKQIVALTEVTPQPEANLVQIDDTHMMYCGAEGSQLLRLNGSTYEKIFDIPENQVLVYGFND